MISTDRDVIEWRTAQRRRLLGLGALIVLLAAACLSSLLTGSGEDLSIADSWHGLWTATPSAALERAHDIVYDLRLPRTVLGLLAGLALGAAGALVQGHTRNPLTDPGMLGVNAGASCAVVIGVFLLGSSSTWQNMWLGLAGALIATAVVFLIATGREGASPLTLVLAGIGLSACLTAVTSAVVLSDTLSMDTWRFWNVGSTAGREWNVIQAALPFIAVGLVIAFIGGYFLNVLALGDDVAHSLGSRVAWIRISGLAGVGILAGAATAACGPIAFLGLVVPHAARAVVGPDYRWIVPYSALMGAVLLVACDVAGRILGNPAEIPASVMLAVVGVPVFIAIIRHQKLPQV